MDLEYQKWEKENVTALTKTDN